MKLLNGNNLCSVYYIYLIVIIQTSYANLIIKGLDLYLLLWCSSCIKGLYSSMFSRIGKIIDTMPLLSEIYQLLPPYASANGPCEQLCMCYSDNHYTKSVLLAVILEASICFHP